MTRTRSARRATTALLALLFLSSCALFRKQEPLSSEQAYARGMEAYNARKFGRAAVFLTRWVEANAAGDPRMPGALLALGRSHLNTREYLTAGSEFLRILTDYATSPEQVEARYGICQAYRGLSPKAPLDQQYTEVAITYCESFAGYYPDTPQADTAREWITEMREKLAEKSYLNGMFYFRRGAYDAAVIYFTEAADNYPQTRWAPAALLKVVEAYEKVGYREEAEEARARLRRLFPQSEEARSLVAPAAAPADSAAPATP